MSTKQHSKARASDYDRMIGAAIRERRIYTGMSQQELADKVGVTYQQAHKYERGINRISAGRLFEIAQVLGVPVSHFFAGLENASPPEATPAARLVLEAARNLHAIADEGLRTALAGAIRAAATAQA
jgi:transcriptional regulator with XRE-family HTH domain